MRRTYILLAAAALITLGALVAVLAASTSRRHSSGKLAVTASFYPMAEFARQVGGSLVSVQTLVRPGIEPHDYDPTSRDIARTYDSRVFIHNGAGLEAWADKLSPELQRAGVTVVKASQGIDLHPKDASDTENIGATDPHVWMDPVLAQQEVTAVKNGLSRADPAHRAAYQANAVRYLAQLQALDASFRAGLQQCSVHTIITSHQAFAYLGARYGFTAAGIAGLSPDNEPSPAKLADIAALVRRQHVHYIFFETLVSPKLAQTIAQETGAQTLAFNPLEGLTTRQQDAGQNYLSIQKDNLQALRTALHCQ